jgi:hypothetical protein
MYLEGIDSALEKATTTDVIYRLYQLCTTLVPPEAGRWPKERVYLTFILLMCTFGRAPDNASKWEMGFNSVPKG